MEHSLDDEFSENFVDNFLRKVIEIEADKRGKRSEREWQVLELVENTVNKAECEGR